MGMLPFVPKIAFAHFIPSFILLALVSNNPQPKNGIVPFAPRIKDLLPMQQPRGREGGSRQYCCVRCGYRILLGEFYLRSRTDTYSFEFIF